MSHRYLHNLLNNKTLQQQKAKSFKYRKGIDEIIAQD